MHTIYSSIRALSPTPPRWVRPHYNGGVVVAFLGYSAMLLAIIMSTYDSVVNKMPGSAETPWSQLGETSARGLGLPLESFRFFMEVER